MRYATWQRLSDKREYVPKQSSPENHYINHDVVKTCLEMLTQLSNKEEALVDDIRTLFVYGRELKPKLPLHLFETVNDARAAVRFQYQSNWKRHPYEEEFSEIFDRANKAR